MKRNYGFSLTEVIITIAIIAVLATISGPIYNSYSTKSKQAEGYMLLGTIKEAQMKYFNDYGTFLYNGHCAKEATRDSFVDYTDVLGIDARANKYYKVFNINNMNTDGANLIYIFRAVAAGSGLVAVTMTYNITSGTAIQ